MAVDTVQKKSQSIEDRMDLAKKANEEICALIASCRGLHRTELDDIQQRVALRGALARIEQLSDIAWTVLAEEVDNFTELEATVEFLGPV